MKLSGHEQRRYDDLAKRGIGYQAMRVDNGVIRIDAEHRRVFSWEWMARQGIEGAPPQVQDQLQAVLDAEQMTHLQDWRLLRPMLSTVGLTWTARVQTYLDFWPRKDSLYLSGSTFESNTFQNVHFRETCLTGSAFSRCRFVDCDLSGVTFAPNALIKLLLERCTFERCWLPGEARGCFDAALTQRLTIGGPDAYELALDNVLKPFFVQGATTR